MDLSSLLPLLLILSLLSYALSFPLTSTRISEHLNETCDPSISIVNVNPSDRIKTVEYFIFVLDGNYDYDTQVKMLNIYRIISCMLPSYPDNYVFYLIILNHEKSKNAVYRFELGSHLSDFGPDVLELKSNGNATHTDPCEQLRRASLTLQHELHYDNSSTQQFFVFQLDHWQHPYDCMKGFNSFLDATNNSGNYAGIFLNIITLYNRPRSYPLARIANQIWDDPRYISGEAVYFDTLETLDNDTETFPLLLSFISRVVHNAIEFDAIYTEWKENQPYKITQTPQINNDTTPAPERHHQHAPSIVVVSVIALLIALLILAAVIGLTAYNQNIFTSTSQFREHARRHLRFRGARYEPDTVALVDVPMENLSLNAFGDGPKLAPLNVDIPQENGYIVNGDTLHTSQPLSPSLIIEFDEASLQNVKLDV